MSNPWEYRQVMKAAMQYGEERTVEQVLADQERAHEQRAAEAERKRKGTKTPTDPERPLAPVPQGALDDLRKLLANTPIKELPAPGNTS